MEYRIQERPYQPDGFGDVVILKADKPITFEYRSEAWDYLANNMSAGDTLTVLETDESRPS